MVGVGEMEMWDGLEGVEVIWENVESADIGIINSVVALRDALGIVLL